MNALSFVLVGCFWGLSYPAIKITLAEFPPFFAAAGRVLLSLLFLLIIAKLQGTPLRLPPAGRKNVWTAGLFLLGIPFIFLFWGQRFITPGLAAILNSTVPIWTFIVALLFLRHDEPPALRKLLGIGCGLCGILFIYGPHIGLTGNLWELAGIVALTIMALCYGIGNVLNRRLLKAHDESFVFGSICHQHGVSFLLLATVSLLTEPLPSMAALANSWRAIVALLYLAFFSTALAWILYFRLLRRWGSVRASGVTYLPPVVSLIVDFVAFGNIPRLLELAGALTIFVGIFLIQNKNISWWKGTLRRLIPSFSCF